MTLVYHLERAPKAGPVREFLDWWAVHGPFPIVVTCGERTDKDQLEDFKKGRMKLPDGSWVILKAEEVVTRALRAADSAHGHVDSGADCSPVREAFPPPGGVKSIYLGNPKRELPEVAEEGKRRLTEYARLAEEHGLESGRTYPGLGDLPHICRKDWREQPLAPGVAA